MRSAGQARKPIALCEVKWAFGVLAFGDRSLTTRRRVSRVRCIEMGAESPVSPWLVVHHFAWRLGARAETSLRLSYKLRRCALQACSMSGSSICKLPNLSTGLRTDLGPGTVTLTENNRRERWHRWLTRHGVVRRESPAAELSRASPVSPG